MSSTEMTALDDLHQLAKKTAALLRVAIVHLDELSGFDDQLEDLSYLLDAVSQAADAAVTASKDLATRAVHAKDA